MEPITISSRSQRVGGTEPDPAASGDVVTQADEPSDRQADPGSHAQAHSDADPTPHATADCDADPTFHAAADCEADADLVACQHVDPPRLANDPSDRSDL
jgi:hypothetical protein